MNNVLPGRQLDSANPYGLVMFLPLWEGSGSVAHDIVANRCNAVLTNIAQSATSGWSNGGIRLDGTDDYLLSPAHASVNFRITDAFSVLIRLRPASIASGMRIIAKHENVANEMLIGVYQSLVTANRIGFGVGMINVGGAEVQAASDQVNGRTYDICGTWTGSQFAPAPFASLYIDGVLQGTATHGGIGGALQSVANINIGRLEYDTPGYFNGLIDYVAFSNRLLTEPEIKRIHTDPTCLFARRRRYATGLTAAVAAVAGPFCEEARQVYFPRDFARQRFLPGDVIPEVYCPTDESVQVGC